MKGLCGACLKMQDEISERVHACCGSIVEAAINTGVFHRLCVDCETLIAESQGARLCAACKDEFKLWLVPTPDASRSRKAPVPV